MTNTTTLALADGRSLDVYVARPAALPRGGVVVLQEIFGVNSHIRSVADGFAAEGYVAVAPAMFQRVQPGVELGYGEADMAAGMALKAATEALPMSGVLPDMQATVDLVARLGGGKVGVVGYCWGGLLTWRAACLLQGVTAAVPYYGGGMTSDAERLLAPRCPVLAHFADEDKYIPVSAVESFRAAQPRVEVHLYRAHHGFNCDQRGSWNAAAAELARERTLAFLARWVC